MFRVFVFRVTHGYFLPQLFEYTEEVHVQHPRADFEFDVVHYTTMSIGRCELLRLSIPCILQQIQLLISGFSCKKF